MFYLLLLLLLLYKLIFSSTFARQMSALTYSSGFNDKYHIGGAFLASHLLLFYSSMTAGGLGQGHHWQYKDSPHHHNHTHTADGGGDVKPSPDWPVGHCS